MEEVRVEDGVIFVTGEPIDEVIQRLDDLGQDTRLLRDLRASIVRRLEREIAWQHDRERFRDASD